MKAAAKRKASVFGTVSRRISSNSATENPRLIRYWQAAKAAE
jgi:hypothetical protein